ncbi:MAG: protein kinase [Planctomycetota bacterium]
MTRRPHDLLPGDRVGTLRVVEEIGRGAFGAVYRAHDEVIGRDVALKVVGGLELDDARWALIEREIKVLGRLAHPNIVTLHHIHVTDDGRRMLEMELVEGMDLEELLELEGPLPPDEAVRIAQGVCGALGAAHEQGIVHRDIKPANVMLGTNGAIKLLDFGLGRDVTEATRSASADHLVGTPHYMAPELLQNQRASPASDVWSMGVLLYRALTGHLPFDADSITNLFHVIHAGQPPELDANVPAPLRRAVTACLQRDAAARPASATELATLLGGGSLPPSTAREVPPSLGEPAPQRLFGRERLVTELQDAVRATGEGHGSRHVLLGAEAVGKSAVLEAMLRHARRAGGAAFRVEVDRLVGVRRALAEVLRRGADDVLAHDPVQVIQFAVEALSAQAARGPVVLGIDDLDQANRDDLALLLHLLRALDATPVMVVMALRSGGQGNEGGPLTELLRHPGLAVHALEPLDEDASHELITAYWAPRLVDATLRAELVRRGGGFPGLLLEVMREAEASRRVELSESRVGPAASWRGAEAPLRLREMVSARLDRLTGEERELLEVASVAGQRFSTDWIAEALSISRLDALRRLQRLVNSGGWIASTGVGGTFTSGVVRAAVYGSVIPELRRELHRMLAVAEWESAAADPAARERAARHWARCGELPRAVDAGLRAIELLPRGETVRSIELAEEVGLLTSPLPQDTLVTNWAGSCRLVSCLVDAGRGDAADRILQALEAARHAPGIGASQRAELALRRMTWQSWNGQDGDVSAALLSQVAEELAGTESGRQGLYLLAMRLIEAGDAAGAAAQLQTLLADAERAGDMLGSARSLLALGRIARSRYAFDEARDCYRRARDQFAVAHHRTNMAVCDINLSLVELGQGQLAAAQRRALAAWARLDLLGARGLADRATLVLVDIMLSRGDASGAKERTEPLLSASSTSIRIEAHLALRAAALLLGRPQEAASHLSAATELLDAPGGEALRVLVDIERICERCQLHDGAAGAEPTACTTSGMRPMSRDLRVLLLVRLAQLRVQGHAIPRWASRQFGTTFRDLPPAQRRLACALARRVRSAGTSPLPWPSAASVCALLGQNHAAIKRAWAGVEAT